MMMVIVAGESYAQATKTSSTTASSPRHKVRGTIIDEAGTPIVGASVILEGTQEGVISDAKGAFTISARIGDKLTISFIGYQSVTIEIKEKKSLTITLRQDITQVEEVEVVAFARQRKESVLASISTV